MCSVCIVCVTCVGAGMTSLDAGLSGSGPRHLSFPSDGCGNEGGGEVLGLADTGKMISALSDSYLPGVGMDDSMVCV